MDGEQFSLCWNNFQNNLRSGFHALLKDEDLVDVTLAADGHYLKAHKAVLSICSPYLKELFRANPGDHPIIILPDVSYSALQSLLEFMYQGEVSVNQDEIPAFMKVAETLKVKGLTENDNGNAVASPANTNGVSDSNRSSPYMSLKRSKQLTKKVIKPIQQLRLTDSPKTGKSSPGVSSLNQPPSKKPCLKPEGTTDTTLLNPKPEPIDDDDDDDSGEYDETLDMSEMLDTTISEPGRSSENWLPDYSKGTTDTSSPGTLQCVLGKRGNPRLIVDSHTFFKKSTYKGKSFWYCKHSRTPYRCQAVCWTLNGNIVKWPSSHSHVVMPEPFNPEEDMEVPIERLQEVLLHYGGLFILKSRKGHPVLICNSHMYTLNHKEDNRSTWFCVKRHKLNCEGCLVTTNDLLLLSYNGHNHAQLNDVIQRLKAFKYT